MKLTRCTLKVTADPDSSYSNALCGNLTMEGGSAEFRGATAAVELDDADGLSLSKELQVRGAATYDGALGEVTLPEGGKSFLAGNAEAQLVVIAPAEKPEPSPVPVPETPATGDGAHPALWLVLMAFAGAAAIAAQRKCR